MQNFATCLQTGSLFMQKQMIFIKIFEKILEQDLTLQIVN